MLPDRVSNPGPLTYESGALPIALRDPAKKKGFLYSKFYFENKVINRKMCKKKYLSWVYDVDRKIRHSGSLFGITRQAS